MAKVPLPERGQPLDVTYIYQLADTLNDLSTQVSSATYNYTTIDTTSAGNEKTFAYDFDINFKYAPIVSATPINIAGTPAGQNVTVVVNKISQSRIEGVVRFNASGDLSLAVHLIAIGIPN